ncbi:MAG: zinc-binding dehydrogenase [Chloroflexi bacterium]|nr:zinc-binding dehydrogenase [Chloroflexota bacterium]
MRAIRVHVDGNARRLVMEEVPAPVPRPGQLLVKVAAFSVNHSDLMTGARGGSSEPFVPGLDVGGMIEAVGEGVSDWEPGDRIIALVRGSYAEFALARPVTSYRLPEGMGLQEGASIPGVFLTAWYGLTRWGRVKAGETVLVHAAGSGVGAAAIQIAHALGARVVTSAGSDSKVARGIELGAEAGINYSTQDVTAELQRLTQGKGVDMVLDSVGGQVFDATLPALAHGGRVVMIGSPAGARGEATQETLQSKGQSIQSMGVANDAQEDSDQQGWVQLKAWFENGVLRPVVDRTLPWTEAEAAHQLLRERAVFGKIVLTVE